MQISWWIDVRGVIAAVKKNALISPGITSIQISSHSRVNLHAESICHCSVSLFWRYIGGEKMETAAPFHVGMSDWRGLRDFVSKALHLCIFNKVFSTLGGGKQKRKCVCSLFLFSLRSYKGYDFLWFVEQTYSAGDVPQKYTHIHGKKKKNIKTKHTHTVEYSWRKKEVNQIQTERNYGDFDSSLHQMFWTLSVCLLIGDGSLERKG